MLLPAERAGHEHARAGDREHVTVLAPGDRDAPGQELAAGRVERGEARAPAAGDPRLLRGAVMEMRLPVVSKDPVAAPPFVN